MKRAQESNNEKKLSGYFSFIFSTNTLRGKSAEFLR